MAEKYVLEVLNPRGERKNKVQGLTAPRIPTIEGKKIAVIFTLPESVYFSNCLAKVMQEKYPTAKIDCLQVGMNEEENLAILANYDAFVDGVRLSGGWQNEPPAVYEKKGIPGIHMCMETMYSQATFSFLSHGLPTMRIVSIPTLMWIKAENKAENYPPIAEYMLDKVVKALTDPLTEEEKNPTAYEYDFSNLFFEGEDYEDALKKFEQYFLDNALSDGIAVLPPTPKAVDYMLTGTSRDRNEVLRGVMQPGNGIVTVEKVAIAAAMAGAKPEYMPVILTAVELLIDPGLLSWHALAAINSDNIAIYVGGPIAKELGMSGRGACFGPGTPANNIIGHAVSLCALNCGWIEFETHGGMYGQPSRFCNLVFTDNQELSPWETYSESRGFGPEDSTVMVEEVFYLDGTFQLGNMAMPSGLWTRGLMGDLDNIANKCVGDRPALETMRKGNRTIHGATAFKGGDEIGAVMNGSPYILVMYPGEAQQLAEAGYDREKLARYICDSKAIPWDDFDEDLQAQIRGLAESGTFPGLTLENCQPGGKIPVMNSNRIAIMVAGHMSGQTIGMHCLGSYGSRFTPVEGHGPFDSPFHIKKITGATLTKAGR